MTSHELMFVTLPLTMILAGIIAYEIKTYLIKNEVVFPSAVYFLIVSGSYGSKPWWHYPLGMLSMLLLCLSCEWILNKVFGREMIGGGGIKLLAVIGAALGVTMAIEVGILFVIYAVMAVYIAESAFGIRMLPSSPLILFSVISIYIWNYGFRFFIPI